TAPYFHNGSIPSLEDVLDSVSRPRYWLYPNSPSDFNQNTLGWNYRRLDSGKDATKNKQERIRIYDTTARGYSNSGHTFGDQLSREERGALIEYIKTL
ncbi:MAG: hypothetical protein ACRERV_12075, partial [Methylococcales bacterium]